MKIFFSPLPQEAMIIGGNSVRVDLQVRMKQRATGRRQMILRNCHEDGFGIVLKYVEKIIPAVDKAVGVR